MTTLTRPPTTPTRLARRAVTGLTLTTIFCVVLATAFGLLARAPRGVTILGPAVEAAIRFHRERPDGSGPFGLRRRQIPIAASVVGVAHTFDALTQGRLTAIPAALEFIDDRRRFNPDVTAVLRSIGHVR